MAGIDELLAGLIGWPVAHSLSPMIHTYFMQHYRITGSYKLYPVAGENLLATVTELVKGGFTGLNVTVPHKIAAISLCNSLAPSAESAAAVNTLLFQDGNVRGFNTDVAGFAAMVAGFPRPFYILGSGGAAAAVSAALSDDEVFFLKRGEKLPPANRPASATVVNATPLGWKDDDIFPFRIPDGWYFADLNYNPHWKWRNDLGIPVITGEKMLVEQAAGSFGLWTGHLPDDQLKRRILERIKEELNANKDNQSLDKK